MKYILCACLLILLCGCITPSECRDSYSYVNGECCLDENKNGVCDDIESSQLVLVVNTSQINVSRSDDASSKTLKTTTTASVIRPTERTILGLAFPKPNISTGGSIVIPTTNSSPVYQVNECIGCNGSLPQRCYDSLISLSDSSQDGYAGDTGDILDGFGDGIWSDSYNMVGDLPGVSNISADSQFKTILSFPIGGIEGNISDAKLNVAPYITQGASSDVLVDHIPCVGAVSAEDYAIKAEESLGAIVKDDASNEVIYWLDITASLQADINAKRMYSCYRLYMNQTFLAASNNGMADRRIFYGFGSHYPPYLTFISRPCIRCSVNNDCGDSDIGRYKCLDHARIVQQFIRYRCENPGQLDSKCTSTQDSLSVAKCRVEESCIDGEDRCFLKECYGGMNETKYESVIDGIVCDGPCRPCYCLNGVKDEGEKDTDCGGECTPCALEKRLPSVTLISPGNGEIYGSNSVYLRYLLNKYNVQCFFSLNGDYNSTLNGDRYISAREGLNNLRIYCNDSNGIVDMDEADFSVDLGQSICPLDGIDAEYQTNLDQIVFFNDNSAQTGPSDRCTENNFKVLTMQNDSSSHSLGPFDLTSAMKDRVFGDVRHSLLMYSCSGASGYELWTVHATKKALPENLTEVDLVAYFQEIIPPAANVDVLQSMPPVNISANFTPSDYEAAYPTYILSNDSYWRIYPYNVDNGSVNFRRYLDIPYLPMNSSCSSERRVKYQILNLTGLSYAGGYSGEEALNVRLALYSSNRLASIGLMETELYVHKA
jgi:hypothetical protein